MNNLPLTPINGTIGGAAKSWHRWTITALPGVKGVNPLLIAVLATTIFALTASAITVDPHSQAYGQYVWGDYILVGNTVMRCITATDQDTRDANSNGNFTEVLGNVVAWAFYSQCDTDTQQTTNPAVFDPVPNDQRWMVYNNTDTTTAGIFNSSQTTFSIPPGADIKFARLYWSGNRAEATNDGSLVASQVAALQANGQAGTAASPWYSCNSGSATSNWTGYGISSGVVAANALVTTRQKAARRLDGQLNQMQLRVNSGAYLTFTADEGPYSGVQNFGGVYYAAQANATTFIQQQLDANEVAGQPTQLTVTGANVATGLGFNCHGGWSLAVVYAYPARNATYAPDYRFVEIFDGYAEAVSSTGGAGDPQNQDEVNIALSSFTPAAGVVEPRFGVIAYEGDQGLVNDQLQFEFGEPQQTTVTEPKINLTTNYFASTIGDFSNFSTGFNPSVSRSPNFPNNDGVDVKVDGLNPSVLTNSGANLNVRIFSSGDRFVIQAFTFSAVVSSISGTVYEDNDNDGQVDAGEAGIANVTLTLTGTDINGNAVSQTVTTNGSGYYVFLNVLPSNATGYRITETQPGSYVDGKDTPGNLGGTAQATDSIVGIVFSPLTTGSGVNYNFGEIKPAQLSGSVYQDLDNDGVQDVGEPGIQGVTITLTGGANPVTAQTNASGFYQFTNLAPGTYTVTETDLAGYGSTGAEQGTVGSTVQNSNAIQVVLQSGENSQQNDFLDQLQVAPALTVKKVLDSSVTQPVRPGEPITFTIYVTNTGDTAITVLPLSDSYDRRYLAFMSATPAPVDTNDDGQIDWSDLTASFGQDLAPNQAFVIKVRFGAFHDTTLLPNEVTINTATAHDALAGNIPVPNPPAATDDIAIIAPTAVVLARHNMSYIDGKVELQWETVSEVEAIAFNVLRQAGDGAVVTVANAEWVKLNEQVIPAQQPGQATGASYRYVDANITQGRNYRYVLEILSLSGDSAYRELGAVTIGGSAIYLPVVAR